MAKSENKLVYLKLEFDDLDALWEALTPSGYGIVIHSLHVFMKNGTDPEPDLEGIERGMYLAYKPKLERAKSKYDEMCRIRAENGAKGGKAKAKKAQAQSVDVASKFKPPTLKQFRNAVDHFIENEELDEDNVSDYEIEKFFRIWRNQAGRSAAFRFSQEQNGNRQL